MFEDIIKPKKEKKKFIQPKEIDLTKYIPRAGFKRGKIQIILPSKKGPTNRPCI